MNVNWFETAHPVTGGDGRAVALDADGTSFGEMCSGGWRGFARRSSLPA